jgi:hypothetical protein
MAAAVAINVTSTAVETLVFKPAGQGLLDSFQTALGISLELLESAVFPFASGPALQYLRDQASPMGLPFS